MFMETTLVVLLILCLVGELAGHGLMQSPPARNYMWRLGFQTERNYDDVGLNCGGFSNQWDTNGGRCGTCGDPYQGPRNHEAGGTFAERDRPISHCYNKNGKIDVRIRITAYHKGYFEFRLCEHNDLTTPVTQKCLDHTLLTISGTNQTRYDIGYFQNQFYIFQLDIPKNVTCQQCVIQWLYNTGNSYGCDLNSCGIGVGPQEQFINCADIAILPECTEFKVQTTTPLPTRQYTSNSQDTYGDWNHVHGTDGDWDHSHDSDDDYSPSDDTDDDWSHAHDTDGDWNHSPDTNGKWPFQRQSDSKPTTKNTTPRTHGFDCYAIGLFADVPGIDAWCELNCHADPPFCPETHCRCGEADLEAYEEVKRCLAVGFWAQLAGFSDWCNINCNHNPSFCPIGMCQCY